MIFAARMYGIILDSLLSWFILFGRNVLFLFFEITLFISKQDQPNSSTESVISMPVDGIFSSCPMRTSSKGISTPSRYDLKVS